MRSAVRLEYVKNKFENLNQIQYHNTIYTKQKIYMCMYECAVCS